MNAICALVAANNSLALPAGARACAIRKAKVNRTAKNRAAIAPSMTCLDRSTRLRTNRMGSGSCAIAQFLSQSLEANPEPRLPCARGYLQPRRDVRERHLFSKVQDEHRTARRSQRRAVEQLKDGVVGCRDLRCGKLVEPRVI